MKIEEAIYLVVYPGHNMSSLLYQKLLKRSCDVELMATPVKITYGCSQAVKFKEKDLQIVLTEASKLRIAPKGIYRIIKKGNLVSYEKIQ